MCLGQILGVKNWVRTSNADQVNVDCQAADDGKPAPYRDSVGI